MSNLPLFPFVTDLSLDVDEEGLALREQAEVVQAWLPGGEPLWLALSYRTARQVLSDPRFSNAAGVPHMSKMTAGVADPTLLISLDAPEHSRIRGLVAKAFSPKAIDALRPWIEELVGELVDDLVRHGSPADLVEHVAAPLPIKVICELLGIPYEDRIKFRDWTTRTLSLTEYSVDEVMVAVERIRAYLGDLIEEKRSRPGDDIVSRLVSISDEDGQRLSYDELVSVLWILLIAGHETVLSQLSNWMLTLFRHPGQLQLLIDRPALIPDAIEELLRYVKASSTLSMRVPVEDVELGGQLIRAGDIVEPINYIANRDHEVFTEPNRLDVSRKPGEKHLSFGFGPHFCLGAQLARIELQIALSALMRRLPTIRLAVDESELRWSSGISRRVTRLPVSW